MIRASYLSDCPCLSLGPCVYGKEAVPKDTLLFSRRLLARLAISNRRWYRLRHAIGNEKKSGKR